MPLAFPSLSHGTVAFGFFNIESDMLLLEENFLFATHFCRHIEKLASAVGDRSITTHWPAYRIQDREAIGDLMGAIHGIRYTGFIGAVYRRFPFPSKPEGFKQNRGGDSTQDTITTIIENYAPLTEMPVSVDDLNNLITMGGYRFDSAAFQSLVRYVWQGGYPRWRHDTPRATR